MNFRTLLAAVFMSICLASSLRAEDGKLSITSSNIQRLKLWVQPGETLDVFASQVCDAEGADCTIFIDHGGKLTATSSVLGRGLKIYHVDSSLDALELGNSTVAATIIDSAPSYANDLKTKAEKGEKREKDISSSKLNTFSAKLAADQKLDAFSSEFCLAPGGPCKLTMETGATAEFTSCKLGERLVIDSTGPLATGLSFLSTDYPSRTEGNSVPSDPSDEQIVRSLSAKAVPAKISERGVVVNLPDVFFEFDKATLTPDARANVLKIAEVLKGTSARKISIEGHTDSIGTDDYNRKLSDARARSVSSELEANGISALRLSPRGFGEGRPVDSNDTDEGRAKNRRVEVILERTNVPSSATRGTDSVTHDLNKSAQVHVSEAEVNIRGKRSTKKEQPVLKVDRNGVFIRDEDGAEVEVTDRGVRIDAGR